MSKLYKFVLFILSNLLYYLRNHHNWNDSTSENLNKLTLYDQMINIWLFFSVSLSKKTYQKHLSQIIVNAAQTSVAFRKKNEWQKTPKKNHHQQDMFIIRLKSQSKNYVITVFFAFWLFLCHNLWISTSFKFQPETSSHHCCWKFIRTV